MPRRGKILEATYDDGHSYRLSPCTPNRRTGQRNTINGGASISDRRRRSRGIAKGEEMGELKINLSIPNPNKQCTSCALLCLIAVRREVAPHKVPMQNISPSIKRRTCGTVWRHFAPTYLNFEFILMSGTKLLLPSLPYSAVEVWIVHQIHLKRWNERGAVGCGMNRGKYTLRSLPHGTVCVDCIFFKNQSWTVGTMLGRDLE